MRHLFAFSSNARIICLLGHRLINNSVLLLICMYNAPVSGESTRDDRYGVNEGTRSNQASSRKNKKVCRILLLHTRIYIIYITYE